MNSKYGFSLIELLVVITVIGILSAIAVPSYLAYSRNTKVNMGVAAVNDIITMYKTYTDSHSGFPNTLCDLGFTDCSGVSFGHSFIPATVPPVSVAAYAIKPYVAYVDAYPFVGTKCNVFVMDGVISNYDSNPYPGIGASYIDYIVYGTDANGTWTTICGTNVSDPLAPNTNVSGCYDLNDPVQGNAFQDLHNDMYANCS